jgi:lipoyl(octanoyl) transferase
LEGETPLPTFQLSVDPAGRSGAENMACDVALLAEADRTGRAFLRLYRFAPPCLSFGRHEPARSRYDRVAIARLGIDVVRRPTGGRAVWHEHEVTYAVAMPIAGVERLRDSYRAIHARLATALRALGADAALALDRPRHRSTALDRPSSCFDLSAGSEVLVAGRKLVGSAQVRQGRALLQHGSILLDGSQAMVRRVSREPGARSRETTLAAVLGRRVTFEEVVQAIVTAWDAPLEPADCPTVRPSSFQDPAWTWRR